MALEEQIQNDIKAALLGGNRFAAEVLRGLKAAILNEKVALGKRDDGLSEDEVEKIIAREVKKRNESIRLYESNGRPELAETEKQEIAVIEGYLPAQMSDDELLAIIKTVVSEMNASPQQMGQVIGAVKAKAGNTADGATIAKLVKLSMQ